MELNPNPVSKIDMVHINKQLNSSLPQQSLSMLSTSSRISEIPQSPHIAGSQNIIERKNSKVQFIHVKNRLDLKILHDVRALGGAKINSA